MVLIGRDRELADLAAFLDAAADRPMAMALLGPPGIGKTSLLGAAAALARRRGFRILGADPPGQEAWRGLVSPRGGERPSPTVVVLRLEQLAAESPVLILLDRADRVDQEDAGLLVEALSHCSRERVSLLLAARGNEPPSWIGPPVIRYRVRPLAEDAAGRLLDTRTDGDGDRIRRHFLYRAAGNPLALLRLGHPDVPLPEEFLRLFDDLPAVTRRLLLHAALADEDEPVETVNRAGGGSPDLGDWAPAERAGLVSIVAGRIYFCHPLTGPSRVAGADAEESRRAYENLAACSDDPSSRASYRAGAIGEPDEAVAAALEEAAGAAEARADYLNAARGLQGAARHSPAVDEAARRYARAVFAAYRTGEPTWALALHREMPAQAYDPDALGVAAAGAGLALVHLARPVEAFELTEAAARRRPRDGAITVTVVSVAATAALMSGRDDHRARLPELLGLVGEESPGGLGAGLVPWSVAPEARASVLAVADPADQAAEEPRPDPMTGLAEVARMLFTGTTAWLADDSARTAAELAAVWQAQRHSGAPGSLVVRLPLLILALMDSGRWAEAARTIEDAEHLAAVGGVPLLRIVLPSLRTILRAWTDDVPTRPTLPEVPAGNAFAVSLRHRALGLSRLATGDHREAYAHFRAQFDESGEPVHFFLGPRTLPQLAMTATLTGHQAEAREIVAGCRRRAGAQPTARMVTLLNHATALLDDTAGAEAGFERATGDPDRAQQWPMEFAEARFSYALWLRRSYRLRESRPHLRAALETYLRLGARGHASCVRRYLPDNGTAEQERRAAAEAFAGLSAQKRQIVQLAATGLTNREIGCRLTLSPRTVGSHLYQVFPVLGVENRHRLRELLADLTPPSETRGRPGA